MYKKWKSVAALGMAVLIGCMMPVDTMIVAAEENPEAGQEIEVDADSDYDTDSEDRAIVDSENAGDEEYVADGIADDENVCDEVDADEDENTGDEMKADDENADDEISADEDEYVDDEVNTDNDDIAVMAETEESEAGDTENTENPASNASPVIEIKWQGESYICSLGGKIDFKYVNINKVDQAFECSASQAVSLSYCLEQVYPNDVAKDEGWMNFMTWQDEQPSFGGDAHYVLYVKAVGEDGQTTYARSGGIVVDTHNPVVTGVEDGKSYPEGTLFKVEDNIGLESVTVNGIPVTLAPDGSYQGSVSGTSCVIWAKDKAGNEMTCSVTVSGGDLAENGIISESGVYSLKAGTPYQLAEGKWQVSGDKSVYSGGSTFYVSEDGDYTFTKR